MSNLKGIDVSKWQGEIDWEAVKKSGVDFVMIRAGYGKNNIDEYFERNISECNRLGIPCGVYWFSYAYTKEMARNEAKYCIEAIKKYKISYPVAFDFEYDSVDFAAGKGVKVTKTLASKLVRAFCEEIQNAGYYVSVYANPNYLSAYFDSNIPKEYDIWLAKWPNKPNLDVKPDQCGGMWQYTSSGTVNGIDGRVDMNVAYVDYPQIILGETTEEKPWYNDDWQWGIDNGITDGTNPTNPITRAETVAMLHRLYNYIKEEV